MKFFSVIIPDLHTPTIDLAIKSLEQQSFDHDKFEVIVVGMDRYQLVQESSLVHFDRSEHPLSPARARNRGALQATGEVLVFMDADCIADVNCLDVYYTCFQNPNIDVVGGGIKFDRRNYWTLADNLSMFHDYLAESLPGEKSQLPSLNLAIRHIVFNDIGGFDEKYPLPAGEDADLTIRLRQHGHQLFFEPKAIVVHHPPRNRLVDIFRHGYNQGLYSAKVDPRYSGGEGLPRIFTHPVLLIICAWFLALVVTLKIFIKQPETRQYWYTFPAILLAKVAWCIGAANRHTR
jgi:GT2 family glycosyltransferase